MLRCWRRLVGALARGRWACGTPDAEQLYVELVESEIGEATPLDPAARCVVLPDVEST